ncbi:MAG: hypothetical protein VYC39_19830, partial [Myxococcota bacterium]|nr:hypothetical protein [Myxococcota bacterium]
KALTANDLPKAESEFTKLVPEGEGSAQTIPALAAKHIRALRIQEAKQQLASLERSRNILKASKAAVAFFDLDPTIRQAKRTVDKYKTKVTQQRLKASAAQTKLGKLGTAHMYLHRAQKIDPSNRTVEKRMKELEKELSKRLTFIVLVEKVARDTELDSSACKEMEGWLRDSLVAQGAKNRSIGMYIVPPEWTPSVDKKAEDAPVPNGGISIELQKCTHGTGTGQATIRWSLEVPRGGKSVVSGEVTAEIPKGVLPKDEQDSEGINARKQLARQVGKAMYAKLESERSQVEQWLITLAEYYMEKSDPAQVADALARGRSKSKSGLDRARVNQIEAFLAEKYE